MPTLRRPRASLDPALACLRCRLRKGDLVNRGLCGGCYATPGVRDGYPSLAQGGGTPPHPTRDPGPTDARPGSREKIRVLAARLWAGERLHHRADARLDLT